MSVSPVRPRCGVYPPAFQSLQGYGFPAGRTPDAARPPQPAKRGRGATQTLFSEA